MKKIILIAGFLLIMKSGSAQFVNNTGIVISNSSTVVTNGDWNNAIGTRIINHGVIDTNSPFINDGILDPSSRGGFVLNYSTDLNFKPGGSQMGFLTKKGAGKALTIGTIGIKDSLLLKDGMLELSDSRDTVSLKAGAILLAGEKSHVLGGMVARAGTGDLVFPLGKDGLYLPLKIYKVNAQKVTVTLQDAPTAHTAGPGVEAVIGFPYAWSVIEKNAADTAGYVEMNYPTSLPVVANPIVVRSVGEEYASMGARFIEDSGSRVTVKSYSRRLNGLFSVAQGFPSDPVTDSLALVALFKSTGGETAWTRKDNWLVENTTIDTWRGVTVNGQSITAIELPGNNLVGPVADHLVDILSLQTVDLSSNEITSLPDFTLNPEITALNVMDNNLDFASLEPNAAITGINYIIQGDIGDPVDTEIPVGESFEFSVPAGGISSQYQWKHNGTVVASGPQSSYLLPEISRETMGEYVAEITNPNLPGLILKSRPQKVLAYANVSGKLFADTNDPASDGVMTLYRVQPGAFEPVQTVPVQNDGTYSFEKVTLDDYQIKGFADTLDYPRALPTYYKKTIFWEEADTLYLADNIDALDIVSELEPGPPSGRGSISGYLQEDDGTGRVTDVEKNKRIASAGVSARRVQRTGRTEEEILTLVAYVFTNADGEFTLPNLPAGEYRINFQYPGYPMDETSYTTITIGTALESQVMVEANVLAGKINVRKLIITGLYEAENYHAEVYPNPAVEYIQFRFAGAVEGRTVMLSDLQGATVEFSDASAKDVSVNVSHLRKGIYLLQIKEKGHKVKTLKVSIE